MRQVTLVQLACWADGRLIRDAGPVQINALETDTRNLSPSSIDARGEPAGLVFVALKGPHFDGHDHVAEAARLGARAALVAREIDCDLPQIVVENTARALARLAAKLHRLRQPKTIAITGSNGKTTVKQLLVSIMQHACQTYCNPGNRNNEIGLPLAVIDAPEDAELAVYEMGAGQPGDIAFLADITPPQIALVNNIAPAHLERMHSLLGIADTKAAVYDALPDDGIAVINADDAFGEYFAARAKGRKCVRFGLEASADVRARRIETQADGSQFVLVTPKGDADVWLPLPGRHNVANALAAAALALAAGAALTAIVTGLAQAAPVPGRMLTHHLANGAILIDDSYNANPGSLAAAIQVLATSVTPSPQPTSGREGNSAPTWLILGDMRELGPDARNLHAAAGEDARKAGMTQLFALGELSLAAAHAFGENAQHFDSHAALITALRQQLAASPTAPVMLVKGSRGSAMERIVDALTQEAARDAA